ncbi:RNA polymerase sigma factor [Bernardetia sp.]|uniref:RNA polymerase sigma factor n=1 Tax=Bernardetia sp. TaxID=1937974 RepID=UPI0025BA9F43|nr:sigma-70 family RNA polymerase sigma factor [Bernardetia sp.]
MNSSETRSILQVSVQSQSEEELILAAQNDPKHFRVLYETNYEAIFRFLYRKTNDEALAADLTAQTFVKALTNIHKFEYKGVPFSAWLYRIASNEFLKYYRKHKKMPVYSLEEETAKKLTNFSEAQADERQQERIGELKKVLETLKPKEMQMIELRFFEDKSFKEIGFILETTESAAKMKTYRILEKIKNTITN